VIADTNATLVLMAMPLLVGGIGGTAGIIAFFRWSLGQSTIKTLKENNFALCQSVDLMKNERAEMEKVVQYLRGRIAVLEGLVLLPASIRELSEAMKTRDLEQRQLMTQGFQSIVTAVQARPLLGEQDHPRRGGKPAAVPPGPALRPARQRAVRIIPGA